MKYIFFLILLNFNLYAQVEFNKYFYNKTLRIDYYHSGNSQNDYYSIDELKEEPYWGGSHINLIDKFDYGKYKVEVYDSSSNILIYSRGYSTLFSEWQVTEEARHTTKTYSETITLPYPKNTVKVLFFTRNNKNLMERKFESFINPLNYFITPEMQDSFPVFDVHISGDPSKKVDIVLLPEGYRKEDIELFRTDCKKFTEYLLSFSPYKENKNKFNIRGVEAISPDAGTDIPAKNIWKKTILNTSFYTFDVERYLMTSDNKAVRNLAANAPYDQIYILVNSDVYGGGAIYNHYSVSVNKNPYEQYIFVHEFGHGFGGLGDEYSDSTVAYQNYLPLDIEPVEPNLTTLVQFNKKWKELVGKNVPVPTPVTEKYKSTVGAFEGGGYVTKGVYRPSIDCMMNTFKAKDFCPVCRQAILNMIDFYSK